MPKMSNLVKKFYSEHPIIFDFIKSAYDKYRKNMISFNNYDRQHLAVREGIEKELDKIVNFRTDYQFWFYERRFERDFARLFGKKFGVGVSSGTAALQFSLVASGIKDGDEVITVPYNFIATALAIFNMGAKPVFVDIDIDRYTIDAGNIEDAITEKTKAILPVHLYGCPCNMNEIAKIAKANNLKIIEDCAQAHGAEYKGKKVPVKDIGCFSFNTSKILGGLGNGGIVVTNDRGIKNRIDILRDPAANDDLVRLSKRTPCFLDAVQIAFIKAKLPFFLKWVEKRREIAHIYNEELKGASIETPVEGKNVKHSYFRYVIRSKKRDKLGEFLFKHGVETQVEYDLPLHLTRTFRNLGYKKGDFPITEKCSSEVLSLPLNPFLEEDEIMKIIKLIKLFDRKN